MGDDTVSGSQSYPARDGYLDPEIADSYEASRFNGVLGRYRFAREQRGVAAVVEMLPSDLVILDCPCGIGRWWPLLATRASTLRAFDISPAMLDVARRRAEAMDLEIEISQGDAEAIELPADSVDAVFSHALTKHLPLATQARVLEEFARVSREWVVCSFSLVGHLSYEFWRRRSFAASYPMLPEQLVSMASDVGLDLVDQRRCTTPIGVEFSVLLRRAEA